MAKITHIFKTYFPETNGGLEEAIRQYANYAKKKGFDVDIISVGHKDYRMKGQDGINIKFYKKTSDFFSNPFSFSLARSFRDICENTDILHFHFPWPTVELLVLFHGIRKPALVTFHCDIHKIKPLKMMYVPFLKQYLKKMDKICITHNSILRSTPYLTRFKDKIEEIPLFIDENRFRDLPGPDPALIELTRKMKGFVLFVGALRWYKGLDTLLDASKKMDRDIVIVGKGALYQKLEDRIKKEGLRNVYLMGFQNDGNYKFLIERSSLVVLPSIAPAEAFGQALLEGLYFSKPLVSTELGTATSFVNRHNYTGYVVRPGCSEELALAMNTILKDDQLRKRFSKNAFQHYLVNFTASVQGEKYVRLYKTLL